MNKVDLLIARMEAKRTGRLRVTFADGTETVTRAENAIPLWLNNSVVRIEPLDDMQGQGRLLELLSGLCEVNGYE